jgi:hypothetical protein
MFLLMAIQYGATQFRRRRIRLALLEENGRGAAVKRGNLARAEKVPGADRLLEDQMDRKERCGATGYRVSKLLETDALATQIGVGELFLRWRWLARVGYAVRERGLLRGEQQQRQQSEKQTSQFHIVLGPAQSSVARWPENVRTQVMHRL